MKSNWQILSNISGTDKKYLIAHAEEKLIRPADAINAMEVVRLRTIDECKKKKK